MTVFPSLLSLNQTLDSSTCIQVVLVLCCLVLEARKKESLKKTSAVLSVLGTLTALIVLLSQREDSMRALDKSLSSPQDSSPLIVILVSGAVVCCLNLLAMQRKAWQLCISPAICLLGLFVLVRACLQTSLWGYAICFDFFFLVALLMVRGEKPELKTHEASCKMFFNGLFTSLFGFLGFCLLYLSSYHGADFFMLQLGADDQGGSIAASLGLGLVFLSILFKSSFIGPIFWAPSSFEAAPLLYSGFILSTLPLASSHVIVTWKTLGLIQEWTQLPMLALFILIISGLLATVQSNLKRFLGYMAASQGSALLLAFLASDPHESLETLNLSLILLCHGSLLLIGMCHVLAMRNPTKFYAFELCHLWKKQTTSTKYLMLIAIGITGLWPSLAPSFKSFVLPAIYHKFGAFFFGSFVLGSGINLLAYLFFFSTCVESRRLIKKIDFA